MIEVIAEKTSERAADAAAERLNHLFQSHSAEPILFLSAGGSSLRLLSRIWVFPSDLALGVTDERFSSDPADSNFARALATLFFKEARRRGAFCIDTRPKGAESLQDLARRFEAALLKWKSGNPNGRIIITQGMGRDGHTAGIMPFLKEQGKFAELFEEDSWVAGYEVPDKSEHPLRVTVTLPFLRLADHSVLFAAGKEKADALSAVLSEEGELSKTPSRIIHDMKEVHFFHHIVS